MNNEKTPPELHILWPFFRLKERELFQQNADNLQNLEDLAEFLYANLNTNSSSAWKFLLGRVLYHIGKNCELEKIFREFKSPEITIWYLLWLLAINKLHEFERLITQHEKHFMGSPFQSFYYYLWVRYYYRIKEHAKYREFCDNCSNSIMEVVNKDFTDFSVAIYKYAILYLMVVDIHFIKDCEILSIAIEKSEELIELSRAMNDRIFLVLSYEIIGCLEMHRGNHYIAYQYLLKAQAIAEGVKYQRELISIYSYIAELYIVMGHFKEALFWLNNAEKQRKRWPEDLYSLAKIYSKYADLYLFFDKTDDAYNEMKKVLKLIPELTNKDFMFLAKYTEVLLYLKKEKEAEELLKKLEEWQHLNKTLVYQNYFLFLKGFFAYNNNNFSLAEKFLKESVVISDYQGDEFLSYKGLALLLIVFLWKYSFSHELSDIIEADKCIEDIIAYMQEKAKFEAVASLLYTRAKIKIAMFDYDSAIFLLAEGEKVAQRYAPEMLNLFKEKELKVEKIKNEQQMSSTYKEVNFNYELKNLLPLLQKESKKLLSPKEENPFALLILHSSGIPIRSYLNERVMLSDDLLFGGFVSVIKHLVDELFVDRKQGFLSVDRGQYKLLIEFYDTLFSVVIIALRDSFMLRRKLHMLVEQLANKEIFATRFKGKLAETTKYELDSIVKRLFNLKRHSLTY